MLTELEETINRERILIQELEESLDEISGVQVNTHPDQRAPNILNFSIPGVDGESLFMNLDLAGIAVSNGSACTSGAQQPSSVLTAIGLSRELAQATIRVSIGRKTTRQEVKNFIDILQREVYKLQKARKISA